MSSQKIPKKIVVSVYPETTTRSGEGGIRTHVALITPKRFRVVLVMTTSIRLHN